MEGDVLPSAIDTLILELDEPPDNEHPEIALADESGWTLSAFPSGLLVWENVETGEGPWHQTEVTRAHLRRLLVSLAGGLIGEVGDDSWKLGHG